MKKAVNKVWFNLSLHFTMLEKKILESKEMHKNGLLDAQKHLISSTRYFVVLSNRCSFVCWTRIIFLLIHHNGLLFLYKDWPIAQSLKQFILHIQFTLNSIASATTSLKIEAIIAKQFCLCLQTSNGKYLAHWKRNALINFILRKFHLVDYKLAI